MLRRASDSRIAQGELSQDIVLFELNRRVEDSDGAFPAVVIASELIRLAAAGCIVFDGRRLVAVPGRAAADAMCAVTLGTITDPEAIGNPWLGTYRDDDLEQWAKVEARRGGDAADRLLRRLVYRPRGRQPGPERWRAYMRALGDAGLVVTDRYSCYKLAGGRRAGRALQQRLRETACSDSPVSLEDRVFLTLVFSPGDAERAIFPGRWNADARRQLPERVRNLATSATRQAPARPPWRRRERCFGASPPD